MSNRVTIEPTTFINERSGVITHGFRAHDDYGSTYNNTFDKIVADDLAFLADVMKCKYDNVLDTMIDYLVENQRGIEVGGTWYDWEQIESIVDA